MFLSSGGANGLTGGEAPARARRAVERVTGLHLTVEEEGPDSGETAERIGMLTEAFSERYDKAALLRGLLLGQIREDRLYQAAARFHLPDRIRRTVYLIECASQPGGDAERVVKSMFLSRTSDLFSQLDERRMVLIRAAQFSDTEESAERFAHTIVDMLNAEAMTAVRVGYDRPAERLTELAGALRHAAAALEIGRVFNAGETVMRYDRLGVGRLIHDLPEETCRLYLKEVFGTESPEGLDQETLEIINAFFENNLNISETARHLYVHRNTLVYRLEKLTAATGLDLRNFDGAMKLRLALMISDSLRARAGGDVQRNMQPKEGMK